jgi:hypothetical protein
MVIIGVPFCRETSMCRCGLGEHGLFSPEVLDQISTWEEENGNDSYRPNLCNL